jgi:DNA-3-methyladenine glycosylase
MRADSQMPDPRLRLSPEKIRLNNFTREFFLGNTVQVARALIGAWLARQHEGIWYGARIVETEAYLGSSDPAAHSWRGRRTPRVEPMYMEGGHLYVFLVYGMHHCANVVTRRAGIAEAVLLRAAEGPPGTPVNLLSGPGKLCAHMGITAAASGSDFLSGGDLRLIRDASKRPTIGVTPRIGVDYAGEAKDWPLRFFDLKSSAVSGPLRVNSTAGALSAK